MMSILFRSSCYLTGVLTDNEVNAAGFTALYCDGQPVGETGDDLAGVVDFPLPDTNQIRAVCFTHPGLPILNDQDVAAAVEREGAVHGEGKPFGFYTIHTYNGHTAGFPASVDHQQQNDRCKQQRTCQDEISDQLFPVRTPLH